MPKKRLEDELRAVWEEWSAPPDYGLWHEHKEPTPIEKTEEALGFKAKEEAAPDPPDLTSHIGGGGASSASSAPKEEEDEWGDTPTQAAQEARKRSHGGPGGFLKRGRELARTPSKPRQTRSVSFSGEAGKLHRQIDEFVKRAEGRTTEANSKRIPA